MKTYRHARNFEEHIIERLKKEPELLHEYIQATFESYLEDGDDAAFLIGIRQIAKAHDGGITALSKKIKMNRQQIYRALSRNGNPTVRTLMKIMGGLGYGLRPVKLEGSPQEDWDDEAEVLV